MDAEVRIEQDVYEFDVVDGELVDADATALTASDRAGLESAGGGELTRTGAAKLQTAAAAATGFVAGAATLALLRHYGAAKLERVSQQQPQVPERRRPEPGLPGRATTYIVHVRPLTRPE